MKYKFKPNKFNLHLMISMFILLIFCLACYLVINKYSCFIIYSIITIFLIYIYFSTRYILTKDYFMTNIGFINIKIPYKNIIKVFKKNDIIYIQLKKIIIDVYPSNKDKFIKKLKKEIKENR